MLINADLAYKVTAGSTVPEDVNKILTESFISVCEVRIVHSGGDRNQTSEAFHVF